MKSSSSHPSTAGKCLHSVWCACCPSTASRASQFDSNQYSLRLMMRNSPIAPRPSVMVESKKTNAEASRYAVIAPSSGVLPGTFGLAAHWVGLELALTLKKKPRKTKHSRIQKFVFFQMLDRWALRHLNINASNVCKRQRAKSQAEESHVMLVPGYHNH